MPYPLLTFDCYKKFADFALDVNVSIPSGITAIFGPSGSGKTTMLNCVAGLTKPDAGEILLNNRHLFSSKDHLNLPPEKRNLGYVFQESLLFPHYNIKDNILYGFKISSREQRKINPSELIELLKLESFMDRKPNTLSTGERQRVALARALATSPELLLMDEPLASIDLATRSVVLPYLRRIYKDLGIPILYVSHSISEIISLATHSLIISQGKQLYFGESRSLLQQPYIHPIIDSQSIENILQVEVVSRSTPLIETRISQQTLWLNNVPDDSQIEQMLSVIIRSDDIILTTTYPENTSAQNILEGIVQDITTSDTTIIIHADIGQIIMVSITVKAMSEMKITKNQIVYLSIQSSSILILR